MPENVAESSSPKLPATETSELLELDELSLICCIRCAKYGKLKPCKANGSPVMYCGYCNDILPISFATAIRMRVQSEHRAFEAIMEKNHDDTD